MASPPLISDPFFSQLDPELREAIMRLTTNVEAIRCLSEFLSNGWLTCRRAIATASPNARFYCEQLAVSMATKGLTPVQVVMLRRLLDSLFAACMHPSPAPSPSSCSPSPSSSSSAGASPSPSTPAPKRTGTSDSAGAAKKAKEGKPRTFNYSKLTFINPDSQLFWQYAITFAELLEPVHADDSLCPGCNQSKSSSLPYNFWSHCAKKCKSRAGAFLDDALPGGAVPSAAPPPAIAARFCRLSQAAKGKLPSTWRVLFDPQDIPAGARDAPAAPLAGSPVPPPPPPPPPAPSAPIVPPPNTMDDEPLPNLLERTAGSFGSSVSSVSAFISSFLQSGETAIDPTSVFQQDGASTNPR